MLIISSGDDRMLGGWCEGRDRASTHAFCPTVVIRRWFLPSREYWLTAPHLHDTSSSGTCIARRRWNKTIISPCLCLPSIRWLIVNYIYFHPGFFIRTSLIPVFLRWAQYLCAIKYAINLVLLTEFNVLNKSCQGDAAMNCKNVLSNNDISVEDTYIYILVIIALFIGFRAIGAVILVKKAKRFY